MISRSSIQMKLRKYYVAFTGIIALIILSWYLTHGIFNRADIKAQLLAVFPQMQACGDNHKSIFVDKMSIIPSDKDTIDQWSELYHTTVSDIIEEQLTADAIDPQCDADSFAEFLAPPEKMQTLLDTLYAAQKDEDLKSVSVLDTGAVLFEWLRQYECALFERSLFLTNQIAEEMTKEAFDAAVAEAAPVAATAIVAVAAILLPTLPIALLVTIPAVRAAVAIVHENARAGVVVVTQPTRAIAAAEREGGVDAIPVAVIAVPVGIGRAIAGVQPAIAVIVGAGGGSEP